MAEKVPTILIHRLPHFHVMFKTRLETRFHLLDPVDSPDPIQLDFVRLLLCVGPSPIAADFLRQLPALECVVCSSAGVDHVDLPECRSRGISVTNAGDAFSEDVADYAVAMLIDVLRRISASDRRVRSGIGSSLTHFPLGNTLGGKRIGIVGYGSIGSLVANRLKAFGCSIAYNSRTMKQSIPFPFYSNIHDLAANTEVLIVCCSLTTKTHHIISKDVMSALGKDGIIINVGRGALIDELEMVRCLVQGELRGAGLDVFENEPSVPEELFGLDNVVLSPHMAIFTPESFAALEDLVIANLEAFFSDKPLVSPINFE